VESHSQDVTAVTEQLRSQDIDVVRVSYSDMLGVDRGRDVLLSELPAALSYGLAFSRCIFHTTPTGETIPIQGGIEDGLPDVIVKPDLSTLAPLPWEPGVMACLGDTFLADGTPAPESPRTVVSRVAEHLAQLKLQAIIGPELEYLASPVYTYAAPPPATSKCTGSRSIKATRSSCGSRRATAMRRSSPTPTGWT
jgi:glutamine synthetase